MELWIATSNQGKVKEFKTHLPEFQLFSLADLGAYAPPAETGTSFEANARLKAKSLKAVKPEAWVVGEDSGLEVKGLNNNPGIYSARYAGDHATDIENIHKILKMLKIRSPQMRDAQFQCCMVVLAPDGKEYVFTGSLSGNISKAPAGDQGFGYDPIFIPENEEKTLAQLGLAVKNRISHRTQALKQFLEILKTD